jgi:Ca-activated chloride channel family protein
MFTFSWPWMGLLLLLPLLVRFLLPALKFKSVFPILRFPHLNILQSAFPAYSLQDKKTGKPFLILLALLWLCLVLAMMRPQFVDQLTEVENKGYDIMLAVDLSGSMRALDFSTEKQTVNRLDVAKTVVSDFVKDRESDRIGLVLFGDSAYQYAPLTLDTLSVSQMLNETVISMAGDGTAIGDAIGIAVKGLRNRPEKSRIIILLTDGEDTASSIPPIQAAQLAKEYGIRIYTIGIGHKGQVPYPGQLGRIVMVETNIDEELLRAIADRTGGNYFHASDTNALREVYEHIDKLEKTEEEARQYMIRTPLYRYPLSAGLLFLLAVSLLPLAEGRRRYGV